MTTELKRDQTLGWLLVALAALLGLSAAAMTIGVGRFGLDQLWHPLILTMLAVLLGLALLFAILARWQFRTIPTVATIGPQGVTVGRHPILPWPALGEVVVRTMHIGYGPREIVSLCPRLAPSDIAAQRAERIAHSLLNDLRIAPSHVGLTTEALLAMIDVELAKMNLARVEPPQKRFRLAYATTSWRIGPRA
jgi:hypothetical protein